MRLLWRFYDRAVRRRKVRGYSKLRDRALDRMREKGL